MNWSDPGRAKINGYPMYYWQGKPVGPLHGSFHLESPYVFIFTACLLIRPNVGRNFTKLLTLPDMEVFCRQLEYNPEAIFQSLGWVYEGSTSKAKSSLSAADLGL